MPFQSNKPASSINLEDTTANFPALKYKFARSGMSDDLLTITCPISGAVMSHASAVPFVVSGDFGFARGASATVTSGFGAGFGSNEFLFIANADVPSGIDGATRFGDGNNPNVVVSSRTSAIGYNYAPGGAAFSTRATLTTGAKTSMGVAIKPEFDFEHQFGVLADGTTVTDVNNHVVTDSGDAWSGSWAFPDAISLATAVQATYYSVYVLVFENGLPDDEVIIQGMEWMAANRDKGLPPMWKDLA